MEIIATGNPCARKSVGSSYGKELLLVAIVWHGLGLQP
jgi:hypothetical protein